MATRSLELQGGIVSRTMGKDGVVRMKILMKRQQLEQILEQVVKKNDSNMALFKSSVSKSLEWRLKEMKRIRVLKSRKMKQDCRSYWRPALQSIPEARELSI
ncbi:hypothetical protein LXL04_009681 [Taraxacum kok-saghyz]